MSEQEYKIALSELEKQHQKRVIDLKVNYALSNNPYKIGDILQDPYQIIRVDNIKMYNSYGLPTCVYHGSVLKKDLTPRKDGKKDSIYQCNIEHKL